MLKIRLQAKFCYAQSVAFAIVIKQEAKQNFHEAVKLSLYILHLKSCLTQTERICTIYYHTSYHDSKVSDANVLPNLQIREATKLLSVVMSVLVAATLIV